ncbi:MAG: hypothetical protein HY259_01555, partial [Chloroflexi bacterium]|nr:hypothetical protein [Chloroflexota bacterium]
GERRGQTLVLVGLMLVGMLGVVALAIDGGNLYVERRRAQNAADAAALEGTFQLMLCASACSEAAVRTALNTLAEDNGLPDTTPPAHDAVNNNLSGTYLNINGVTLGAMGGGSVPAGATGLVLTTTHSFTTYFAGLLGFPTLSVGSSAVAQRQLVAIWSAHDVSLSSPAPTLGGTVVTQGAAAAPFSYTIADYRPGGVKAVAAGIYYFQRSGAIVINCSDTTYFSGSTMYPGLYYFSNSVTIQCSNFNGQVTLVAETSVTLSGSNATLTSFSGDLLMLGGGTSQAVSITGDNPALTGNLDAPAGTLNWTTTSGSLTGTLLSGCGSGVCVTAQVPSGTIMPTPKSASVVLVK